MARWRGLWPGRMHRPLARLAAWMDLLIVDLGLMRAPVNRPVVVAPGVWRSNQPTPWRLNSLARRGFKSVLNLRGAGHSGAYHLERYHCDCAGLALYDLKLSSRRPPTLAQVRQLWQWFETAPRPLLVHCKSGADRAGLVAALYLLYQGQGPELASRQLSWRYLHVSGAATGVLDHFLESYAAAHRAEGLSFADWLANHYDRTAMMRDFRPRGLANWLVERVLRRE